MRFSGLKTNESDNDGGDGLPYEYFPTTMYEDYALNEFLFCMKIMLFVREQNRDEYRLAMSYVFLG